MSDAQIVLPFTDIKTIDKKMTALVIPNAISISTPNKHVSLPPKYRSPTYKQYTFASFISRDTTFDVMMNIWRLCNPNAVMSATSADRVRSRAPSDAGDAQAAVAAGGKGHAKTECACGKEGKHFTETALSTTFPSTPEKVYNLMFNSGWLKEFMSEDQKLKGEWLSLVPILVLKSRYRIFRLEAVRRDKDPHKGNILYQTPKRIHRPQTDQVPYHRRTDSLRLR